jgi:dolichyl-phosphate beta-glucosyltransferase
MKVIIVPCYNEQKRLDVVKWQELIARHDETYWVFIDDGSVDETLSVLNQISSSNLAVICNAYNLGKGETIRNGFIWAQDELAGLGITHMGYLDADGAFDVLDIDELLSSSVNILNPEKQFSSLIGARVKLAGRNIQRDNRRHFIGRVISTFICLGWNLAPYDTQSGFKMFRVDDEFRQAIRFPFKTRWFFDIELLIRLEHSGSKGALEVPLNSWTEIGDGSINRSQYYRILKEIFFARGIVKKHITKEST